MFERDAQISDAKEITDIFGEARRKAMPWLPMIHTREEELGYFTRILLPEQTVRLICTPTEIAGFAAYKDDWLNHLYIRPDHWRKGIGHALLSQAKASTPVLQLWAFQDNHAARAFYKAAGFTEVEHTDGQGNEEKTPDVRLCWRAERSDASSLDA